MGVGGGQVNVYTIEGGGKFAFFILPPSQTPKERICSL